MSKFLDEVLLEAAKDGNLIVLKTALEKGANINAKDGNGKTALIIATERGHIEIINHLKEKGAVIAKEEHIQTNKLPELPSDNIVKEKSQIIPDKNWKIIFSRQCKGLFVMNSDGSRLSNLLNWGEEPDVSPDGTKIVFSSGPHYSDNPVTENEALYYHDQIDSGYSITRVPANEIFFGVHYMDGSPEIYSMDLDGSNLKKLTDDDNVGSSFPKFSPDGSKIAFKRTENHTTQIWIMELKNKRVQQITQVKSISYFYWRFDNNIILADSDNKLFVIDPAGKNIRSLNIFEENDYEPKWSKDGKQIIFCNGNDLFIMDSNGRNRQRLTEISGWIGGWSPDNQWIVFSSRKMNGNGADIFIIRKDGKHEHRLTDLFVEDDHVGGDFDPCWAP